MTEKSLGQFGEGVATNYLLRNDYKILEKNYKKPWGEIDIVAKKGKDVIFVEVKTLFKGDILPEESVNFQKRKNLIKTARTYLWEKKYPENQNWQIDVIGIEFIEEDKCRLRHTKNAIADIDISSSLQL